MSVFTLKRLIELTIGSPEPGYVNFYALQCVLHAFAERLNIEDEQIDCTKYDYVSGRSASEMSIMRKLDQVTRSSHSTRMLGGADIEEEEEGGTGPAEIEESAISPETHDAISASETVEAPSAAEPSPAEAAPPEPPVAEKSSAEPDESINQSVSISKLSTKGDRLSSYKSEDNVSLAFRGALKDVKNTVGQMESRLVNIEQSVLPPPQMDDFLKGVSIMKDQLEVVMGQLHLLTSVVTQNKDDTTVLETLREISNTLYTFRKDNVFIESSHQIRKFDDNLIGLIEPEQEEEPEGCYADNISRRSITSDGDAEEMGNLDLDMHLTYTADQLLEQLVELKTDVCTLTNKVNTLTANMEVHDSRQTKAMVQELFLQFNDIKTATAALKEAQEWLATNQRQISGDIADIMRTLKVLKEEKVDKSELTILLAEKADYSQLQKKVSLEQQLELQCRLEKQFCEIRKLIGNHTENIMQTIDHLRNAVGPKAIEEIVRKHKEKLEQDINTLRDILHKYIEATNDDCLAAGARIKVLQDLACLCCDTTCNMRTIERARVPKLPSAHASNMIAPLITYELGSIRKSGVMGYYRKDEFPHSPNAWQQRQALSLKQCAPRHAGGPHTITTPKDKVEKVTLAKK